MFTAQDAARITCKAIQGGASREDIDRRIEVTCPDDSKRRPDPRAVLEQALSVAQGNIDVLNDSYQLFFTVNAVLLALLALPAIIRRTPGLFIIFRGLARVQTSVAAQVTVIGRQVAANESVYTAIQVALRRAA